MSNTAIDLSQIAPPTVIETLDFETIFTAILADLQARDPLFDALVESDPLYKILEVVSFRELLLRQRINDASHALLLPYAAGTNLDNLAALYNVERLLIDSGDPNAIPPLPPIFETDNALRRRVQLAPAALSTAGSRGSYGYHALSSSALVADVRVESPTPGAVQVTVLSTVGDGKADQLLLDTVAAALNDDDVRPLTDQVTVQAATIVNYTITANLFVYPGPDGELVRAAAETSVKAYAAARQAIGEDVTLSGLFAALHQPGVQRVELAAPLTTLVINTTEAAYCTATIVTLGGIDE